MHMTHKYLRVRDIYREAVMEIAVAHVSHQRADQPRALCHLLH